MPQSRKQHLTSRPRQPSLIGRMRRAVPSANRKPATYANVLRMQPHRRLLQTLARFRTLYKNMLEAVAYCRMLDADHPPQDIQFIDVNQAFEAMTGLSNVVGKKLSEAIPGIRESNPELIEICANVTAQGRPKRFETQVAALDRWFSISAYRWGRNSFVAIFDNITERKRIEEETEDLYRNAPCGYHSLDANGVFVRINDTELRWLGYTREEVIGKLRMPDLLVPASRTVFEARFANLIERGPKIMDKGASANVELEMIRKDGTLLPVRFNATVVRDARGGFVMTRTTVNDISATRMRELERTEHARRMEELSRRLVAAHEDGSRILATELHDRTSANLVAMEINLEMVLADLPAEWQQGIGSRLEDTCALLKDTTQNIREINTSLRPALLDYAGLRPALHAFAEQFSSRTGIAVHFTDAESTLRLPPEVESNLFRIAQEALTNCAKYAAAKAVVIELQHDDARAVMTICDDGIGFDPAALGQPGHPAGLGIITMRERAEFTGGRFSIESHPGKGTRIRVEI